MSLGFVFNEMFYVVFDDSKFAAGFYWNFSNVFKFQFHFIANSITPILNEFLFDGRSVNLEFMIIL